MKFFVDNCISPKLVAAVQALTIESEIIHLRDKFAPSTTDPVWLAALGREGGWTIVSGDPRITRGRPQRSAWLASGLTAFFFSDGFASKQFWKQAHTFVYWWPTIEQQAALVAPGAGFLIPLAGSKLKQIP